MSTLSAEQDAYRQCEGECYIRDWDSTAEKAEFEAKYKQKIKDRIEPVIYQTKHAIERLSVIMRYELDESSSSNIGNSESVTTSSQ